MLTITDNRGEGGQASVDNRWQWRGDGLGEVLQSLIRDVGLHVLRGFPYHKHNVLLLKVKTLKTWKGVAKDDIADNGG